MKLYAFYTEEGVIFRDIFVNSLKDSWEINLTDWGRVGGNVQNAGSTEFAKLMRRKIELIIKAIKKEMGNIIIWSDVDIQFFGVCTPAIEKAMANNDMVFQAEHWPKKEVNTGFIVIRCNTKTLTFFETVLKMNLETMQYYEQSAVNKLLHENTVSLFWDILPQQFWAKSHGGPPPRDILLHHANATFPCIRNGKHVSGFELKLEQFAEIKDFIRTYSLWKWHLWGRWRFWAKALIYRMVTTITKERMF